MKVMLLEDLRALEDDVGAAIALGAAVRAAGAVLKILAFEDANTFVVGMTEVVGEANATDQPVLLVVSSHGKEATGTWIDAKRGAFSAYKAMHLVPPRPGNLTIFISACWGLYPDIPGAMQWRSTTPPVVIGPLVEIVPDDADAFQACLVAALRYAVDDDGLVALVHAQNDRLRASYGGRDVFGIVLRDGERIPEWGTDNFAGRLRQNCAYEVVALQRSATMVRQLRAPVVGRGGDREMRVVFEDDLPDVVVLDDDRGRPWHVQAAHFWDENGLTVALAPNVPHRRAPPRWMPPDVHAQGLAFDRP